MGYVIKNKNAIEFFLKPGCGLTNTISDSFVFEDEDSAKNVLSSNSDSHLFEVVEESTLFNLKKEGKKILILGSARHGKDTLAEIINKLYGLTHLSSSVAALDIFLFDILKDKYGLIYKTKDDAYIDRVNHRNIWFNEICLYNSEDPTRLVKEILKRADIYVGLRSKIEVEKAIEDNIFDHIIGIHNYRLPIEDESSNTVDAFKYSDILITNNSSLDDLKVKVKKYLQGIL